MHELGPIDGVIMKELEPARSVWFFSELYYPEEISTGHTMTRIAESLAGRFPVKVICGRPDYSGKMLSSRLTERRNGVLIERCVIPPLNKNSMLSRALRAGLLTGVFFVKAVARIRQGDIVIAVTNPVTLPFAMALACKIRGAKFVFLVHDVFPENAAAAGLLRLNSWTLGLLAWIMTFPYVAARDIIVVGRDMKEIVAKKRTGLFEKIAIITNWADSDDVRPMARAGNPMIESLGLKERFIVQFAGNLGRVQGLDYVLKAADILKAESVHFLFIGDGARKKLVEGRAAVSANITLLGSRPRNEQSLFLSACDVGIVSLAPGAYGVGVPSKAYNILASGRPVIAQVDENSEIGRLVREEDIGWVVAPGDAEALARAILEAKKDPERLSHMGARARALAETKYSFQHIAHAYGDVLDRVVAAEA